MPANIMCCITDTVSKRLFIKFQQYFTCNFFFRFIFLIRRPLKPAILLQVAAKCNHFVAREKIVP